MRFCTPVLVCQLSEQLVLLWKRGSKILALGEQIYDRKNSRLSVEKEKNGNRLVVRLAEVEDGGEYECQVSAFQPTFIKHRVSIRGEMSTREGLLLI